MSASGHGRGNRNGNGSGTEPEEPEGGGASGLDLAERGLREGERISLDRRLFVKFTAYGRCGDVREAVAALAASTAAGALYLDAHDPRGIGLVTFSADPEYFVTGLRALLAAPPFSGMERKAGFDMLGRTYTLGYEPDLEHALFTRPIARMTDPALRWAVWYPLRRAKRFATLSADHQRRILMEHGSLGRRYGEAGAAHDVRLACHGLDPHDNDFVIGLLGAELFPLSSVVQAMRGTEQTSQYLDRLGPFFVGRTVWQAGPGRAADGARGA